MDIRRYVFLLLGLLCFVLRVDCQVGPNSKEYRLLKESNKLQAPVQAVYSGNYPTLKDNRITVAAVSSVTARTAIELQPTCDVENPQNDATFSRLERNDDGTSSRIALPFDFNLFGDVYSAVYVNNNGNITFNDYYTGFTSTGFPVDGFSMVAPFWADVDTESLGSGLVYYKVEATRFTVIWYRVGYYNQKSDKLNTFKLIITNGADASVGIGNNVGFFYGDMQWTTGDHITSQGVDGFGGVPATVGLNKGIGSNNCFFYQLGRFNKPGTEYISAYDASGVDYLDNKCFFFDASIVEDPVLNVGYEKYFCAVNFYPEITNPQNCKINTYKWDFGDGTTSLERNPIHSFASDGTYTVTLNVSYSCGSCTASTLTKQIEVNTAAEKSMFTTVSVSVPTESRQQVLAISASSFSDAWSLLHDDESLANTNSYLNGSLGVWRNEGSFVYKAQRIQSTPVDISKDGTFDADLFNWNYAALDALPGWIRATTVTEYSPDSYELENRDVLNVYTAALYDYGGTLASAIGSNMKNEEMAFTGFEYSGTRSSGNWIFSNQSKPTYSTYAIYSAQKNVAVVEVPVTKLEGISRGDVSGRGYVGYTWWYPGLYRSIINNDIVCIKEYPDNPKWSIVVFRRALFSGIWTGKLTVRNVLQPVTEVDIDSEFAHTGKKSLRISSGEKTYRQELLKLDSGEAYFINAWVSVKSMNVRTPLLADNLGIDVILKNSAGNVITVTSVVPGGAVVAGWQQVRGAFLCPDSNLAIELKFKPGSTGTAWYDDLRLHPEKGNMKSYVYNLNDYRLRAVLDEENFATLYFYDDEGNLFLTKKETATGIKTLSENISYIKEQPVSNK